MLHWYVNNSSVVISGCETREFQKAKARRVLVDYWDKKKRFLNDSQDTQYFS